MATTSSVMSARDRARAARAAADQDRAARDKRIEQAQVAFFTAADRKAALQLELVEIDRQMASQIDKIVNEGEALERVAVLLDTPKIDLRRIRGASRPAAADPTPESAGDADQSDAATVS